MQFRNDIQGLRAIAFILVYIFHLNPHWLPGGYIGVDMFFVISGYLITSIILHQKEKGTFSFLSFYEKRIKRIVPAYYVAILFIAVAGCYFYLQADTIKLRSALYRTFAFISNQYFASGESYFGAKLSENPVLHTWSLAIEMQFYLILPLLLIFIRNKWLPYIIGGLLIILTVYSSYRLYYTDSFSVVYFSLLSRIPEFFVGVLLSILSLKRQKPSEKISTVISAIGIIGLGMTAFLINEKTPFPGVVALIPCTAIGLLLISGENIISKFLSSKPMVYIGELSYSLYLWHWPIMAYLRYSDPSRTIFSVTEIIIISLLTSACAWLSYTFVEKIFRKQTNKKFAISFSPIVLILGLLIFKFPSFNLNGTIPQEFTKTVFGTTSHNTVHIETFGDLASADSNIVLIGDSHALAIKPFLDYIGKQDNFSFKTLTCAAYPPIEGIKKEEISSENQHFFQTSLSLINSTKKLTENSEIILFNSLGFHRIPSLATALDKFASSLNKNQKLIVFITVPSYNSDPMRMNRGIIKKSEYKFERRSDEENKKIIQEVCNKYPNVYLYDLSKSEVFADGPFYQDTLMYYDKSHLNLYGALALAHESETDFITFFNKIRMNEE